MKISVKPLTSDGFVVFVADNATAKQLKEAVFAVSGIAVENQRLVYSGKVLVDEEVLAGCGVKDGHAVHLVQAAPVASVTPIPVAVPAESNPFTALTGLPSVPSVPSPDWPEAPVIFDNRDLEAVGFLAGILPEPLPWMKHVSRGVQMMLYSHVSQVPVHIRAVNIILEAMENVAAHTLEAEPGVKEVHLNSKYFAQYLPRGIDFVRNEVFGVLWHETTHVWQYNGHGTLHWAIIEGIADYIRIRAGFSPPHWKPACQRASASWEDGYDTTGFFLIWIEDKLPSPGFVKRFNLVMRDERWSPEVFQRLTGHDLSELWRMYQASLPLDPSATNV